MDGLVLRVQQHGQERTETFAPGVVKIGSLQSAHVRLERVAPIVAAIDADEDGALLILMDDEGAVTVNGEPVRGKVRLRTRDSVVVAGTTLTVVQLPTRAMGVKATGRANARAKSSPLAIGFVLLAMLGLVGAVLGPALWADLRAASIRSLGARHMGTVLSIEDTGSRFNENPVVWVTLEVDLKQRKVRGRVKDCISPVHLPRFQPGRQVQVWIDPMDPTRMALEEGL